MAVIADVVNDEPIIDFNQIRKDLIGLVVLEKYLTHYFLIPSKSFKSYYEGIKPSWRRQIGSCVGIAFNVINLIRVLVLIIQQDEDTNMLFGDTSYILMKPIIPQSIYFITSAICIAVRVVLLKADNYGTFEAPRLFHHLLTTQSKDLIISIRHRSKLCLLAKLLTKYFIPFNVHIGFYGTIVIATACGYLALQDPNMHYNLCPLIMGSMILIISSWFQCSTIFVGFASFYLELTYYKYAFYDLYLKIVATNIYTRFTRLFTFIIGWMKKSRK